MKYIFVTLLFLLSKSSFGQSLFQNISFNDAIIKSLKSGKLVLIQLESSECEMCNYLGEKAFENTSIANKAAETFIPIFIGPKNPDRDLINGLFNLSYESFGTIFVDGNKNIIHRFEKTTSLTSEYNAVFDEALYNNSEVIRLSILEDIYLKSKSNSDLEQWIFARDKLNVTIDSLLNIYANNLNKDSLNSPRVIDFIANCAPRKGTVPDSILRSSTKFNSVWYAIPLKQRINLNNRIVVKSMMKAIEDKNETYALSIASFRAATYNNDPKEGKNQFFYQALSYYKAVKDVDRFIMYSSNYLKDIYENMTVDTISKIDSIGRMKEMKNLEFKEIEINGITKKVKAFSYKPISQYYTRTYNNISWFIYKNTSNKQYLEKALIWIHRGNEHFKSFEAMDTEARILYKLGNKMEAVTLMESAIKLKNERVKSNTKFSTLDKVLSNMRDSKEIID